MTRDLDKAEALNTLKELRNLDEPSRKVDVDLAVLVGFERFDGEKVVWLHPETRRESRIPRYTSHLSHASDFANTLLPGHVGACTWGPNGSNAQIEPGPPFEAPNAAIALCISALFVAISGKDYLQQEAGEQ